MGGWAIYAFVLIIVAVALFLLARRTAPGKASDAQIIEQLTKGGSNLTRPHNIEFRFYFPYIVRAARSMVPLLSELQSLRSRFDELATREGGIYDGWSAGVVK
jgi:hypothetical protein